MARTAVSLEQASTVIFSPKKCRSDRERRGAGEET